MEDRRRAWQLGLFVLIFTITATVSAADNIGAQGRVLAIRVSTTGSDDYGIEQGAVVVGDAISGVSTYRWGGSRCPAAEMTPDNISMLQRALDNARILIEPGWKPGQGGFQCLVHFKLFLRSEQSLTLP